MNLLALVLTAGGSFLVGWVLCSLLAQRRYDADMLERDSLLQTARHLHMTDYDDQDSNGEYIVVGEP